MGRLIGPPAGSPARELRQHRIRPHMPLCRAGGDEFLDPLDVGPVLAHRHGDHLDAEASMIAKCRS